MLNMGSKWLPSLIVQFEGISQQLLLGTIFIQVGGFKSVYPFVQMSIFNFLFPLETQLRHLWLFRAEWSILMGADMLYIKLLKAFSAQSASFSRDSDVTCQHNKSIPNSRPFYSKWVAGVLWLSVQEWIIFPFFIRVVLLQWLNHEVKVVATNCWGEEKKGLSF